MAWLCYSAIYKLSILLLLLLFLQSGLADTLLKPKVLSSTQPATSICNHNCNHFKTDNSRAACNLTQQNHNQIGWSWSVCWKEAKRGWAAHAIGCRLSRHHIERKRRTLLTTRVHEHQHPHFPSSTQCLERGLFPQCQQSRMERNLCKRQNYDITRERNMEQKLIHYKKLYSTSSKDYRLRGIPRIVILRRTEWLKIEQLTECGHISSWFNLKLQVSLRSKDTNDNDSRWSNECGRWKILRQRHRK